MMAWNARRQRLTAALAGNGKRSPDTEASGVAVTLNPNVALVYSARVLDRHAAKTT
jgi:hypothetical protein